jgi:hypothetical protein
MYQLNRTFVVKALNFLLAIAMIVALLGAAYDLKSTVESGGVDLRNRVVGARLLSRGLDPYFFRWQQGDPETLLDPLDKPELPVSRVTIPPTGLALYIPFAELPYLYQRFLWFFLQWGAVLLSLFLLIKRDTNPLRNRFLLGYGLFFIAGSIFWRMHLKVGQIYVFYMMFVAISYWVCSRKFRFSDEVAGLLLGIAASMRFPALVIILPMLLFKKIKLFAATVLGFLLCIGTSFILFGQQVWGSYFSAMQTISQLNHGALEVSTEIQNRVVSKNLEGAFFTNQPDLNKLPSSNSSIPLLLDRYLNIETSANYIIIVLAVCLFSYLLLLHYSYRKTVRQARLPVVDVVFISSSLMLIITDLLIPTIRYNYNDIQLLVPLILLLKNADFYNIQTFYFFVLLSFGFLISGGLFPWLPHELLIGLFLILAVLLAMSLSIKTEANEPSEVPSVTPPLQR